MTQPGWYPDPVGQAVLRRFDGASWTTELQPPDPLVPPPGTPGAFTDDGIPLATWGRRTQAYLMDALLLWPISILLLSHWHAGFAWELVGVWRVWYLTGAVPQSLADWWALGLYPLWLRAAVPGVVLRVAYDMVMWCWRGQGIGQRQMTIRVVPAGQGRHGLAGTPAGLPWHRALVRSLVMRALAPTVVGWLVCVLWPLVDPARRSLADLLAGTQAVHQRPVPGR